MRGKGVTVRFQDRSVAVVARDVVGYVRPDTVASRFAEVYHARWPSVRLEAFGAAKGRVHVTAEAAPTSAEQSAAMEEIDNLLPEAAVSNRATAEVNPTHGGTEVEGVTRAAGAEPERGSAGVRISPPAEDTTEDAETEACLPEQKDRMTEEDMADLVEVDPPELSEDDLEEDEEDAFRLR